MAENPLIIEHQPGLSVAERRRSDQRCESSRDCVHIVGKPAPANRSGLTRHRRALRRIMSS